MISNKELFLAIRELCESGWHDLQSNSSGAPGNYLEESLGLKTSNHDGPDAGLWELKFSSGKSMLTLFHKTPRPKDIIKYIINRHGWIGSNGKKSFRHTIRGATERGFKVVRETGGIWVRHEDADTIAPHWTDNDLLNSAGSKLRRLLVVTGKLRRSTGARQVMYQSVVSYEQFDLSGFIDAIVCGLVAIDFDAYIKDSGATRDHGTKFRINAKNIYKLYEIREQII